VLQGQGPRPTTSFLLRSQRALPQMQRVDMGDAMELALLRLSRQRTLLA
jgi:hypothetical protein